MSLCMLEMYKNKFSDEPLEIFNRGKIALKELGERSYRLEKFVMKGDEINVLRDCIEYCEALIAKLTVRQVELAIDEVFRRLHYKINTETIKKPEQVS